MEYNIKISLNEIAEHTMTHEERKDMIKHIFFSCMSEKESNETMCEILDDMMQGEQEFDNREDIIKAFQTLIVVYSDDEMYPRMITARL